MELAKTCAPVSEEPLGGIAMDISKMIGEARSRMQDVHDKLLGGSKSTAATTSAVPDNIQGILYDIRSDMNKLLDLIYSTVERI